MKTVARRLGRLEKQLRPAFRAVPSYDPSAPDRVRAALAAAGFVASPEESLAEAWARSMGITCLDLRALLARRAAGRPAE